ncbi:hypothetical protein ACROYT_G008948 [Oculina patagonica]
MTATIRIGVILLSLACCCHLRQLCSSYFTFSSPKQSSKDSDAIAEFKANSELTCALRCSTKGNCDEAIFYRDSKKCLLYQKKDKGFTEPYAGGGKARSRTVTMRKVTLVAIPSNSKSNSDCASDSDKSKHSIDTVKGKHETTGTSCSAILQKNRYVCNDTIPYFNTFSYDSHHWTSKVSYQTVGRWQENKLPGYWLSNFTKICVTMIFPTVSSSILVNHAARSLYSALHDGAKKTWTADLSSMKTPSNIDKNCLVQGLNLLGPQPFMIKSRVGVESQPVKCVLPYLVRGVGITIGRLGNTEMSCGEIIISHSLPPEKLFPAFCRIFIQ